MESKIGYLQSLKEEATYLREKRTEEYLSKICKQLKVLKSENPKLTSAKIDLGLYDNTINYDLIERNICKKSPIRVRLNKYVEKQCTSSNIGFLGYYPQKCVDIEKLIAELRW